MWTKRIAPGFFLLLLSFSAFAKKETILFGGGGEPQGVNSTIFDATYANYEPFSKDSGWQARSYFNGGHAKSEALAQQKLGGANKPMTAQNMNAEISTLKERLMNGDLKAGDQLLLTIATHGEKKATESTHKIATTDGVFNVDELKSLRDLAEKKGVSLAIIDFSCYSGNTLKLGSDKTCVISGAADTVAYNTSAQTLSKNLKKGASLEQAFLKSRLDKNIIVRAAPQISTDAGQKTLNATEILSASMAEKGAIEAVPRGVCIGINNFYSYGKLSSQLHAIGVGNSPFTYAKTLIGVEQPTTQPLMNKLEAALKNYKEARANVQASYDKMQGFKEKCLVVSGEQLCGDNEAWLNSYSEIKDKVAKGARDSKSLNELTTIQSYIKGPEFRKWEEARADFKGQPNLYKEADNVASVERDVYQALYEEYSESSKKPNPCRDFIL